MRGWSIALFRLFGIRLEIHATFLLLLAYVGYEGWRAAGALGLAASVLFVVMIFACVVLHELGHSLVAKRFGIGVSRIMLLPIGGMALFDSIPRQPAKELAITAAGPAVNFLIVALLLPFSNWREFSLGALSVPLDASGVADALVVVNLIMGLFNLLPVFPMDGGRILRALLATRLPYTRATFLAARIGQVLALAGAAAVLLLGGSLITVLLLVFIFVGAGLELRYVERTEKFDGLTLGDVIRRDFIALPGSATVATALATLQQKQPQDVLVIDRDVPAGVVFREDIVSLACAGRWEEPMIAHTRPGLLVLQASWPLLPFAQSSGRSEGVLFPVYDGTEFAGVLDLRHIEEMASLAGRKVRPG